MNKLKLRDFLELYNFRFYRDDCEFENHKYDTKNIRIYLNNDVGHDHEFIEFGVYDFGEDECKMGICEQFIKDNVLEDNVCSIWYDDDLEIMCVMLGDDF